MSILRTIRRSVGSFEASVSPFCLILLLALSALALAAPTAAQPVDAAVDAESIVEHLRDRDQLLERIARRMAHPQGAPVDGDELHRLVGALERMEMGIAPLAEDHPELVAKHQALVMRARQLADASGRSRAQNANLVVSDASIRWLEMDNTAYLSSGTSSADAVFSTCDAAPTIGVETRALAGVDGSRDALLRFVAPSDGRFRVDTAGSRTDTRLQVLTDCGGPAATVLARGDDEWSLRARTQFSLRQGEEVWIRVGSDREGHLRLRVEQLFESVGTASITGTVVAQASGLPIEGLTLWAENGFSIYVSSTDATGDYQFTGLSAGTYEVFTLDSSLVWINEKWDGVECGVGSSACYGVDGDPIVVADGQAVEDIDFALGRAGIVTGTLRDTATGEPIAGARVYLESAAGSNYSRNTDSAGRFRFTFVEPDTYFAVTDAAFYLDELFDDIDCDPSCDVTSGTPIVVAADGVVAGVDFDLDQVAGIRGQVTASAGDPSYDGYVEVFDDQGTFVDDDFIGDFGLFFVSVPGPGTYFARANFFFSPWVDQMWQGIDCPFACDLGLATPIVLGANEGAEISFDVQRFGSVEGTVSAADFGPPPTEFSTVVNVYDESGSYLGDAYTNSVGEYLFESLPDGDYLLTASNDEFRAEVFDDVACAAGNVCDPLLGDTVSVAYNAVTTGVDFELDRLGVIEGRVTRVGGVSLSDITVYPTPADSLGGDGQSDPEGTSPNVTDDNGDYRIVGLEPGSYYVRTSSTGYLDEAYDDVPCEVGCSLNLADEVTISAVGAIVGGIDFDLERQAWIQGHFVDSSTGDPVDGTARLFNSAGIQVSNAGTDYQDGGFLFSGLDDGSYYVVADPSSGEYLGELHEDVSCRDPFDPAICDLMAGTLVPVSVENGAQIDFELDRGGSIQGAVEDEFGNVLEGTAFAFDAMGNVMASDSFYGGYSLVGLPAGDYYIVTADTGHQDELWPNTPCFGEPFPNCTLAAGTPVSVTLGATAASVDFVLEDLPKISGRVVDAETGDLISLSVVQLRDEMGNPFGSHFDGEFEFTELPPGTYYLRTFDAIFHLDAVYGGDFCLPSCDPTQGTPIVVDIGDVVSGIEIPLPMGPGIEGRVIDGPTGTPLEGVTIDLWETADIHGISATTDENGWYRLPYYSGTYFLSTHNDLGLEDFLFDGIRCPDGSAWEGLCDPTDGTPYTIESYTPLKRLDFAFGDPTVFTDGFESGDTSAWSVTVGD